MSHLMLNSSLISKQSKGTPTTIDKKFVRSWAEVLDTAFFSNGVVTCVDIYTDAHRDYFMSPPPDGGHFKSGGLYIPGNHRE